MLRCPARGAVQCLPAAQRPTSLSACVLEVWPASRRLGCAAASDVHSAAADPVGLATQHWQQQQQQLAQREAHEQHHAAVLHDYATIRYDREAPQEQPVNGQQHHHHHHHQQKQEQTEVAHLLDASSTSSSSGCGITTDVTDHCVIATTDQNQQQPIQQKQQQQQQQERIKQRTRRQLTAQQSQQRWQRRQHQKQLKQHQQQLLQQRQQQLSQCTTWLQLLSLAADLTALQNHASWLTAMIIKAAQLHQHRAGLVEAPAVGASAGSVIRDSPGTSHLSSPEGELGYEDGQVVKPDTTDPAEAEAAEPVQQFIAQAADLSVDHEQREFRQQQQFMNNLLYMLGNTLQAAAQRHDRFSQRQCTAVAADPTTLQLCQTLTQLSISRIKLPKSVQQQLAAYICRKCSSWQPDQAAAVLISLARLQPSGLRGAAADPHLQQQLLLQAVPGLETARSGVQTPVPARQAAAVLWAAARLKWRPSQQWVAAAAAAVVQQIGTCSAGQLAMALWGMAGLRCDMLLLQQALQQQQQQDVSSLHNPHHQRRQQLLPRPVAHAPEQLLQAVYSHVELFKAQELLCVLWATAHIPLLPQMQLVQELLHRCQQQQILQQYSDIDIACILWSLARVQQLQQQQPRQDCDTPQQQQQQQQCGNACIDVNSVRLLFNAVMVQLPASHVRAVASALQSTALLGAKPASHVLFRVLKHLQNNMNIMSPGDLASVITAVAEFGFLPKHEWLEQFYDVSCIVLQRSSSEVTHYTSPAAAVATAATAGSSNAVSDSTFTPSQLAAVAAAVCKISRFRNTYFKGQKPPAAWLNALAAASMTVITERYSDFNSYSDTVIAVTPKELSLWGTVFKRFSRLAGEPWAGPGKPWMDCYITVSGPLLSQSAPWDLCNILEFVTIMQQRYGPPSTEWQQAAVAASRRWVNVTLSSHQQQQQCVAATAADLIMMGRSLARLGLLPDLQWQQQWVAAIELTGAQLTSKLHATFIWTKRKFATAAAAQHEQQREHPYAVAAAAAAERSQSDDSTSADSYDSLEDAYEFVCEPQYSDHSYAPNQDDGGDQERSLLDPAAAAADSSSILEGLKLAQRLHHDWERQQRDRTDEFAVMSGSFDLPGSVPS